MMREPVSLTLIQHLASQIGQLTEEQTEALRMATFVGMTEDEAREYLRRRKKIAELMGEFALLTAQNQA